MNKELYKIFVHSEKGNYTFFVEAFSIPGAFEKGKNKLKNKKDKIVLATTDFLKTED